MLAYLSDPQLKSDLVEEIRKHREADQIIKGTYGEMNGKWRACAIGCSIHSLNLRRGLNLPTDDHSVYETHLGIPVHIARLEDAIFEALPEDRFVKWPEEVAEAIRPGADLSMVWPKLALWLLANSGFLTPTDRNRDSIETVIALYRRWIAGEKPSVDKWEKARAFAFGSASASAFVSAFVSAFASTATYASVSAAAYAAAAATYAMYTASAADSAYAAHIAAAYGSAYAADAAWCKIADKLIELLKAA